MRYHRLLLAVAFAGFSALLVVISDPAVDAADETAPAEKVFAVSHRLDGLPVWTQDGKAFNPAVLMAYLSAAVDTAAWGETSTMAAYPPEKPVTLVIVTTRANHDHVSRAMERLRDSMIQSTAE